MKVKCIDATGNAQGVLKKGEIYNGELVYKEGYGDSCWQIEGFEDWYFYEHRFEEIKQETKDVDNTKELDYIEVITNIKEGEIWESEYTKITKTSNGIYIENNESFIFDNEVFILKRNKYTFEKAFAAYLEGKVVESNFNNFKFKFDKENDRELVLKNTNKVWKDNIGGFFKEEISGLWYINE